MPLHVRQETLPVELWLEIFSHLPGTETDTLRRLFAYCRTFHAAARGLVFSEFRCRATRSTESVDERNSQVLRRLQFWCSPDISRFVRSCVLYNEHPGIFDALRCFPQLETLEVAGIDLDQSHLDVVCSLESLVELRVTHCATVAFKSAPSSSAIRCHLARVLISTSLRSLVYPLLLPTHLVHLSITSCRIDQVFGAANTPIFPLLRFLSLDLTTFGYGHAEILVKFPAVEVLVLNGRIYAPGGEQFFPKLKSFSGTYTNMRSFASPFSLDDFYYFLYPQPNSLRSLTAYFDTLTNIQLDRILAQWSNLTELNIRIGAAKSERSTQGHCAESFFTHLISSPVLPPSLERLALRWNCYLTHTSRMPRPASDSTQSVPTPLSDLLSDSRCPKLTAVWVESCEYLLRWRKSVGVGIIREKYRQCGMRSGNFGTMFLELEVTL
ncbi:hypothetical protein C8F01DRAFT_1370633 [Mycena amicta]|nr:hypothetical protein C8F01DRAFT_1370633 [Mycena amicta]